jgi:hypothetical protein
VLRPNVDGLVWKLLRVRSCKRSTFSASFCEMALEGLLIALVVYLDNLQKKRASGIWRSRGAAPKEKDTRP